MTTSVHLSNGGTPLPTVTAEWNTTADAGLVILKLAGGEYARTDLSVALVAHDAERLLAALAKLLDWTTAKVVAPEADERWIDEGGYSPSGNSFGCPIDGCGWSVSGLNSESDPDDAYAADPVAEHYAEDHPGVQLAVDQAGTVAPIVEASPEAVAR